MSDPHAYRRVVVVLMGLFFGGSLRAADAPPPVSWVDGETGHRVVRLTSEPGSAALYFNENGYTPDGRGMIYTTPEGISLLNLATREARAVVRGQVKAISVGRKTPTVYYVKLGENALYCTQMETGETRKVAELPRRGRVSAINADETLAAGTYIEGDGKDYNQPPPAPPAATTGPSDATVAAERQQQGRLHVQPVNKGKMMEERLAARLPMVMFTVDLRTGEVKTILKSTDWLNHLLFSPTDPTLLMYCHEGPWHKVDRIWTIRTDGTQNVLVHKRTMAMEIAGHEFWGRDGRTVWYDLQVPRGEVFYVAGYNVETGERTWYHLERNEWSVHFNVSADGALFCGDGGDVGQVAKAPDGKWIYLFRPEMKGESEKGLIRAGVFRGERLVNMAKHGYRLEPNVSFTPDGKMVVFSSNLFGEAYVFGVEVGREGK